MSERMGDKNEAEECMITIKHRGKNREVKLIRGTAIREEDANCINTIHVRCFVDDKQVGYAGGRYLRRERVRADFWSIMDGVSEEMSLIAFTLFDRYGYLKDSWRSHSVRKGSGVWGSELDFGPLFLIERVEITDMNWRRNGLGRAMIKALVERAQRMQSLLLDTALPGDTWQFRREKEACTKLHTIVAPGWLRSDLEPQWKGKSIEEKREINQRADDIADAFYRSLGFRRIGASCCFGLSFDPGHKSFSLAAKGDFNLPRKLPGPVDMPEGTVIHLPAGRNAEAQRIRFEEERMDRLQKALSPLVFAALTFPDVALCAFYKNYKAKNEADWKQINHMGNTLLHITSSEQFRPQSVKWLLDNVDKKHCLSKVRNAFGFTPLENLQAALDIDRTQLQHGMMTIVVSDIFAGYTPEAVACLSLLSAGLFPETLPDIQVQRLKYGCTCGECTGGFLSPRMKLALLYEAEITYHSCKEEIAEKGIQMGCLLNFGRLGAPASAVQKEFLTNTSLRQGFVNCFQHIVDCLLGNKAPTVENILQTLKESGERPQFTRMYLRWRKSPEKNLEEVLGGLLKMIRDRNDIFGDGEIMSKLGKEIDRLKSCRNDHEYGFIAKALGLPGLDGKDGKDGKDGQNGQDGKAGIDEDRLGLVREQAKTQAAIVEAALRSGRRHC